MTNTFTLPHWYDLHVHFRQGAPMENYIQAHLDMGCAGVLAMPNTKPPVARIHGDNTEKYWTIESYLDQIKRAGGEAFQDIIIPLYLTQDSDKETIQNGSKRNILRSCKYYPPHGTTNADFGQPLDHFIENGTFAAMEEAGIILNIHGEEHGLHGAQYFDQHTNAEDYFYTERMPRLRDAFPDLKIVCEHITTRTAVDFVLESGNNIAATITPQHLLYTVGDLIQGFKYHLYCLPLVKFEKDRMALLAAATSAQNTKFFAGTDSAPHTTKATDCGCAAGCFTGGIAPQIYAQAFDLSDKNINAFQNFLCLNGVQFYDLPSATGQFTLTKTKTPVSTLQTTDGEVVPLPLGLGQDHLDWRLDL